MAFQNADGANVNQCVFNDIRGNVFLNNDKPSDILTPVIDAAYTRSGHVARCLKGTRQRVIAEIVRRVEEHSDHPICWLKGPAGYGKSAISQAVAEEYAARGRLAASFFFLRGAGHRSVITRLIPTISHQLSVSIPSTKPFIQRVIETEPYITGQSLQYQLQKLVIGPILESRNIATTSAHKSRMRWVKKLIHRNPTASRSTPCLPAQVEPVTIVIVIDALDECDDKDPMGEFIEIIINAFLSNPGLPVRFLITSRIEEHIRRKLETAAARSVVHHLSLQEFKANDDIHQFFRTSFATIYEENSPVMRGVSLPWPSEADLRSLVKKSGGSFIFAVTLMDVIRKGSGLPQDKLEKALTAEAGLDGLYTQVLSDAPRDHHFERVIGTIMLIRRRVSVTSLAQLLRLRPADIVQTLLGIQSIIMIPGDDDQSIELFHTSFRDFMTSQPRSGNFFIGHPTRHFSITTDCLSVIAVRPEKGIFYDGVQRYACLDWCYHMHQTLVGGGDHIFEPSSQGSLMRQIQDFASQSLEYWMNTLMLDGYKKTLDVLDSIISVLEQSRHYSQGLVQVFKDIRTNAKKDIENFKLWGEDDDDRLDGLGYLDADLGYRAYAGLGGGRLYARLGGRLRLRDIIRDWRANTSSSPSLPTERSSAGAE